MTRFTVYDRMRASEYADAGRRAAAVISADPPASSSIIAEGAILSAAGLPPRPSRLTSRQQIGFLRLRESWRLAVLQATRRYPATVQGEGFRLCSFEESVPLVEGLALDAIQNELARIRRVARYVPDATLDLDAVSEKRHVLARAKMLSIAVESAQDARKKITTVPETPGPRLHLPLPTP